MKDFQNKSQNDEGIKSCTLYIDGMHCASCEILIEKKLLKHKEIKSVDASLGSRKVDINFSGKDRLDIDALNYEFKGLGYKFSNKKFKHKSDRPLIGLDSNGINFNPAKLQDLYRTFLIAFILIAVFFLFNKLELGRYVSTNSSSSLPAFFLLGLVAGVSSCAALIGGLLLSMIKKWNEMYIDSESNLQKAEPHFLFHSGRLVSFALLGGLLGVLGDAVSLDNITLFAALTIGASIIMIVLALQMLEVKFAQKIRFTLPRFLTRSIASTDDSSGRYMPFVVGAATFFLPCGFTLVAQTIALTSGSFIQGALVMLFFALGTLPSLTAISYSGLILNSKPHLTAKFNATAGLIIIFFAIYNINGQLNVLGYPSLNDINLKGDSVANTEQPAIQNENGFQTMTITAKGFQYIPTSSMTIKQGVPTKLIVDNQGIDGCGSAMAAAGLIDKYVILKEGINEINLGSPKKGTYKLTCTMGMVPPVTITVI